MDSPLRDMEIITCNHEKFIHGQMGEECLECGLLRSTVESSPQKESEWEKEFKSEVAKELGYASSLFMSQECKGTEIIMPSEELKEMVDRIGLYAFGHVNKAVANRENEIAEEVERLSEKNLERLNYKGNRMTTGQTWYQNALKDVLSIIKH